MTQNTVISTETEHISIYVLGGAEKSIVLFDKETSRLRSR